MRSVVPEEISKVVLVRLLAFSVVKGVMGIVSQPGVCTRGCACFLIEFENLN